MSVQVEVDRACPKTVNCVVAAITSRWCLFPSQTYNYFRFPSAILNLQAQEVPDTADVGMTEKYANIVEISSLAGTHRTWEAEILFGVTYSLPPLLATYVMRNTLANAGYRSNIANL